MKVCNLDLEMITKAEEIVGKCMIESDGLEVEYKDNLHFMGRYLEGLRYRIKSDLEAGGHHASSHI